MEYRDLPLYQLIAQTVDARKRCLESGNADWASRHLGTLQECAECLPSGSGFDSGTSIDLDKSGGEKLVFDTSFHHMDENGFYDGWTQHTVTVTPSFVLGLRLRISGRDRNGIKDYIHESFDIALREVVRQSADGSVRPVRFIEGAQA